MMSASVCSVLPESRPILDAGGQILSHREPPLDLTQHQQTAVGGQTAAVEPGDRFISRQSVTGQAMAR
jgi:hypothetical protein